MTYTKLFIYFGLIAFFPAISHAQCDFEKVNLEKGDNGFSYYKIKENLKLVLEGSDSENRIFEGPARIEVNGKTKCDLGGGNYSGVYYSKKKSLLMFEEYSGSCGSNRIIDPTNCKQIGKSAKYCGSARLESDKLINEPPCELMSADGKIGSCSTGKVFRMSAKTCHLSLDESESRKLTKEKLGIELPIKNKAYRVSGIGTPKAKIESD